LVSPFHGVQPNAVMQWVPAGKSEVEWICTKVYGDLADQNTNLLDISSLHVATLMVYK
jgi:hypothetical protein